MKKLIMKIIKKFRKPRYCIMGVATDDFALPVFIKTMYSNGSAIICDFQSDAKKYKKISEAWIDIKLKEKNKSCRRWYIVVDCEYKHGEHIERCKSKEYRD